MRCRALSPECLSRQGAGPVLPSAAASERWGQLCTPLFSLSMGINTDCDDIRAMNLNTGPGNSPGPDIIMALGSNQTIYLSPLLSGSTSSDVLLPTENPAPPITHSTLFTILCPAWPCKVGQCFVLEARGGPVWVSWPCSVCHGAGQEHTFSSEPPQACVWVSRSCSVRHGAGQKQALSLEPRTVGPCGLCFNAHNEVFIVQRCSSLFLDVYVLIAHVQVHHPLRI